MTRAGLGLVTWWRVRFWVLDVLVYWLGKSPFPRSTTDCRVSFYGIGGIQLGEQTWSVPNTPGG